MNLSALQLFIYVCYSWSCECFAFSFCLSREHSDLSQRPQASLPMKVQSELRHSTVNIKCYPQDKSLVQNTQRHTHTKPACTQYYKPKSRSEQQLSHTLCQFLSQEIRPFNGLNVFSPDPLRLLIQPGNHYLLINFQCTRNIV